MLEPEADAPFETTEVEPLPPPPPPAEETWKDSTAELTEEERQKLLLRKQEKEAAYFEKMQKWGKVALYTMFFPTFLSIITIVLGVWCVSAATAFAAWIWPHHSSTDLCALCCFPSRPLH